MIKKEVQLMVKRSRALVVGVCITTLVVSQAMTSYAATGFNSKGAISFAGPDERAGTDDDIVFNADDITVIYDEVSTGKMSLATEITSKGAEVNKAGTIYTFNELKTGIDNVYDKGFDDAKSQVTAGKILKGQNILGINGTATADATATADSIMSGKTAYVNGNKITGTLTLAGLTSDGTAVAGDIRSGKTAYVNGTKIVGTGDINAANILKGKSVMGVSGTATSDATATASNILSGKTAYVNGSKITGTLTLAELTSDGTAVAGDIRSGKTAYVNGTKITGTGTVDAANILKGKSVMGVTGTATSDATAIAADIRSGKTAYINGSKITGTGVVTASNILAGKSVMGVDGTATNDATATPNNLSAGVTAYVNGIKITGTGADVDAQNEYAYHDFNDFKDALWDYIRDRGYNKYDTGAVYNSMRGSEISNSELLSRAGYIFSVPDSMIGKDAGYDYLHQYKSTRVIQSESQLPVGVMAYNNQGILIQGNGIGEQEAYNRGLQDGATTTVIQNIPNATITYHHHVHSNTSQNEVAITDSISYDGPANDISSEPGGCYTVEVIEPHVHDSSCPRRTVYWCISQCNGSGTQHQTPGGDWDYTCDQCGAWLSDSNSEHRWHDEDGASEVKRYTIPAESEHMSVVRTTTEINCSKTSDGVHYEPGCGHSAGELVKAEIVYN